MAQIAEAIAEQRAGWTQEERVRKYQYLCDNYPRPLVTGLWYAPHIFNLKPAIWHKTTAEAYVSGKNCNIAGWRGGAKSTLAQWHMADKMLHFEAKQALHVCRSNDLVKWHAQNLITEFETNARLTDRFNITPGKRQEQDWFQIKIGKAHKEQLTFVWMTRDGSSRGFRFHIALVDDLTDRDDSAYMCEQYYQNVHSTLMGTLEPFGGVPYQIINAGNLTGDYSAIILFDKFDVPASPDRWISRRIPALEEGDTVQWTGAAVGESTWPERHTTEWLHQKRREMNAAQAFAFEMEYQNRLVSLENRIWSDEMFQPKYSTLPPKHQLITRVYIDSAQKVTETGDETAIWKYSKCIDGPEVGKYYRRECRIGHLQPDEIASETIRMFIGNGSARVPEGEYVKLETKTSEGEDPLAALIRTRGRQENVNIPVLPLVPAEHGDKRQRSLQAVVVARSGALYSPEYESPDMTKSRNQMIMFTGQRERNMHAVDDGHDAEVWALIDLQDVKTRTAREMENTEPLRETRNKLRAA